MTNRRGRASCARRQGCIKRAQRRLADPSLAVAALNATPAMLMRDLRYTDQLFESQVIHDLRLFRADGEPRLRHHGRRG